MKKAIETQYYQETRRKLKQFLDSLSSNKIHTDTIMKLPTLKDAHIYCKYNNLSGQFTGPILEKYIKTKYKMTKNIASSCEGDLKYNDSNFEIKASNGGKENNKFNYVQLRMNHNCEYILTAYYIDYENLDSLGELFIFKLNKERIKPLIVKYGNYAHGTVGELGEITIEDLNNVGNQKEYSLRPKYKDKCWNELLQFRIDDLCKEESLNEKLDEMISKHYNLSDFDVLLSPFFSGGSFEFFFQKKYKYRLCGNEKLTPLWKQIKIDKKVLCQELRKTDKDNFTKYENDNEMLQQAIHYFYSALLGEEEIQKIEDLNLDNIDVYNYDFEYFIEEYSKEKTLLFLDVPNDDFDHKKLFNLIKTKKNWILIYKNCDSIRTLYKDFIIHDLSKSEIIIMYRFKM